MLHYAAIRGEDLADLAVIQDKRNKVIRPKPEGLGNATLERSTVRARLGSRCRCGSFRFRMAEPPHRVCANDSKDDGVGGLRLPGLAALALVFRADELSVNKDVIAHVQRHRDALAAGAEIGPAKTGLLCEKRLPLGRGRSPCATFALQ